MQEVWKDIAGTDGVYQVSNLGNVRKYLKQSNQNGYRVVSFNKKNYLVHRLVAEAFIDNPNNLPFVNHKDEIKSNNRADNLEWCDQQYNLNYNGHNRCKKIIAVTSDGEIEYYNSSTQASKKFGISKSAISQALRGKSKTCKGRKWFFDDQFFT